ncbi:MAG: hypothetical protein D6730_00735 [Bacteroidetes bacterium]|nr:MAG: hypothetical protein D6730_00735 [Bacteroidota bacterium]
MRKNLFSLCCTALLLCVGGQAFSTGPEDKQAILRTLNYYFEAVNMGSSAELRQAYHPQATFAFIDKQSGKLSQMPVSDFFALIDRDSYIKYERRLEIKQLDISGTAAFAETVIYYDRNGKELHDFLSLLKVGEQWRIISRVSYKQHAAFYGQPNWEVSAVDVEKIEKTIRQYVKSGSKRDGAGMKAALHPEAIMAYLDDIQGLRLQSRDAYVAGYTAKEGGAFKRRYRLSFVRAAGNVALAKVEIYFRDYKATLTDYLSLIKEGDEWKIIRKVSNKERMKYISGL